MGKKKNKKLKRILRAQALSAAPQTADIAAATTTGEIPAAPAFSKHEAEVIQLSEDKKDVRHEIKKILITIAVLVLIIVAVDLVNSKTDIILKTGQFLTDKLNIKL